MMNRILHIFAIARSRLIDNAGPIQLLQIDEGPDGVGGRRLINKVKHFQHFGFSSYPPVPSEILLGRQNGLRGQTIAFGTNHQPSRPTDIAEGDTCIYDVRGQRIWVSAAGTTIDGAGLDLPVTVRNVPKLRVEATQIECTGDIVANVDGAPISLSALHAAYAAHAHVDVTAGTASTGLTDHPA